MSSHDGDFRRPTQVDVRTIRSNNRQDFLRVDLRITLELRQEQDIPVATQVLMSSILRTLDDALNVSGPREPVDPGLATQVDAQVDEFLERYAPLQGGSRVGDELASGCQRGFDKAWLLETCAKLKKYSENLFQALVRQSSCCPDPDATHEAKLMLPRLEDYRDESVLFLNLFLTSRCGSRWQEVKCAVPSGPSTHDDPWNICELIEDVLENTQNSSIHFIFNGEEFGSVSIGDTTSHPTEKSAPETSLTHVAQLAVRDANATDRPEEAVSLALTLALSLLYLAEDSWPRLRWSSDNIFFEDNGDEGLYLGHPYLYARLSQSNTSRSSSPSEPSLINPYFLSFAQLLWVIASGSSPPPAVGSNGLPGLYLALHHALPTATKVQQELKDVITACLNMGIQDHNADAQCDFIYNRIIRPLEKIARPSNVPRPVNKRQEAEMQYRKPRVGNEISLYDVRETPSSHHGRADDFTVSMDQFIGTHVPIVQQDRQASSISDRIRVAIIDSGLNYRGLILMKAKNEGRFKEGRSWVGEDPSNFVDTNGHGTHVAHQLLRAAPNAAIFVAKIANGDEIHETQMKRISEAIIWAVNEWKVDIISLSFGLRKSNKDIDDAINMATKLNPITGRSTLVFAAAGNYGIHDYIAYPARRDDVIGVHAGDGYGNFIGSFSPQPRDRCDNFATLGIATKSTWEGKEVRKSGTSFATPIAAAVAANMLEFARRNSLDGQEKLRSPQKMKALFRKLSQPREGYLFVAPWTTCYPPCCLQECPQFHCSHCERQLLRTLETIIYRC